MIAERTSSGDDAERERGGEGESGEEEYLNAVVKAIAAKILPHIPEAIALSDAQAPTQQRGWTGQDER